MPSDCPKIDRRMVDVVALSEQEKGDLEYWLARTSRERLEAVEQIRQVLYGYDPLPRDFSELLRLLTAHGVRYLVVGGYAVAYHGYVRATADLDVWIDRSEDNAARVVNAISEFGFGIERLTLELFMVEDGWSEWVIRRSESRSSHQYLGWSSAKLIATEMRSSGAKRWSVSSDWLT